MLQVHSLVARGTLRHEPHSQTHAASGRCPDRDMHGCLALSRPSSHDTISLFSGTLFPLSCTLSLPVTLHSMILAGKKMQVGLISCSCAYPPCVSPPVSMFHSLHASRHDWIRRRTNPPGCYVSANTRQTCPRGGGHVDARYIYIYIYIYIYTYIYIYVEINRKIMLFIGKPKGRSRMISSDQ